MPSARSLKARLALWVLLPTIVIAAVDLLVSYQSADHVATIVQDQLLRGAARMIAEQLTVSEGNVEINVPPAAFELFAGDSHDLVYYAVRTRAGVLVAGDTDLLAQAHPAASEAAMYFSQTVRGTPVRVVALRHALPSSDSQDYAVTQVAQGMRGHDAFRAELLAVTQRRHLFLLALVSIALVVAFRWTLRPLIELGKTLGQRQPGDLAPLEVGAVPVELHPIVAAINDYVRRLDSTLAAYEVFVADTAHHLRTAFAIVLSQASYGKRDADLTAAQRSILDAIQQSVTRGARTINQLLLLASLEKDSERPDRPAAQAVSLTAAVKSVMEELAPLAAQKDIDLGIDGFDETVQVLAPAHLLREMVSNLLDNAIQHGPSGASVTLSVLAADDAAVLRITDTGPGIAPAERAKVFTRFYRIDPARSNSSGLGLSIVRNICDTLGASIALATPANGIGLQVEVRLPRLPAAFAGSL